MYQKKIITRVVISILMFTGVLNNAMGIPRKQDKSLSVSCLTCLKTTLVGVSLGLSGIASGLSAINSNVRVGQNSQNTQNISYPTCSFCYDQSNFYCSRYEHTHKVQTQYPKLGTMNPISGLGMTLPKNGFKLQKMTCKEHMGTCIITACCFYSVIKKIDKEIL